MDVEQARAKADRLDGWAATRRDAANKVIDYNYKHYRSDIAFNTQPGYSPLRKRVLAQDDRALASLRKADAMTAKAKRLRNLPVKGDAAKRRLAQAAERQAVRESVLAWLRVGMTVQTTFYGVVHVVKVNRKTAKILGAGDSTCKIPIEFITQTTKDGAR